MGQHSLKFILAASCAALFITSADAADYDAGFAVGADASHNDNIRLVKNDTTSVNKYDLSPKLTFGINTETSKAQLDSTFDFNRYDKSEFNSDDRNIALLLSRQFESSSLGLNASYVHNSTVTSEQLTSGRIGNKADRAEQYSLSPSWTYTMNESNLVQLSGSYMTQNYQNAAYIGYKNTGAELDWFHLINDRTKLIAVGTYSDYKSDDIKLEVPAYFEIIPNVFLPAGFGKQSYATKIKSRGVQVGVEYQWSEQSLLKARVGRAENRTSYAVTDTDHICTNSNFIFVGSACDLQNTSGPQTTSELDWIWSNERQQFNLTASKAVQPTSNGYAVDATQVRASWSYQLSELNKVLVRTSLVRNRAIDKKSSLQNTSLADRDYGSATLQYQRQLSEYWFVNASFQFSEQKYSQVDYQASARVYSLGISYKPQQWHWAR